MQTAQTSSANFSSVRVAAVVVTYNGQDWIGDCLRHLFASEHPIAEIYVVDNASTDATTSHCAEYPQVVLIRESVNLGFGRANNIGISRALSGGATHVLLVNQDACVERAMVGGLLAAMTEEVGIATPMQWNEPGTVLDTIFLRHYLAEHVPALLSDSLRGGVLDSYEAYSTPAAMWLCSRKMLENTGGFDPLFFMYCEDDDLCRRARGNGFKIVVVPDAHFRHLRGFYAAASSAPWHSRMRRRTIRATSTFLYPLLDPNSRLPLQWWRSTTSTSLHGLQQLLNHGDWVAFCSAWAAIIQGSLRLPEIMKHRHLVKSAGPHWLSIQSEATD